MRTIDYTNIKFHQDVVSLDITGRSTQQLLDEYDGTVGCPVRVAGEAESCWDAHRQSLAHRLRTVVNGALYANYSYTGPQLKSVCSS